MNTLLYVRLENTLGLEKSLKIMAKYWYSILKFKMVNEGMGKTNRIVNFGEKSMNYSPN